MPCTFSCCVVFVCVRFDYSCTFVLPISLNMLLCNEHTNRKLQFCYHFPMLYSNFMHALPFLQWKPNVLLTRSLIFGWDVKVSNYTMKSFSSTTYDAAVIQAISLLMMLMLVDNDDNSIVVSPPLSHCSWSLLITFTGT